MNILIQGPKPADRELPNYINTRIYFAVGRFTRRIQRVKVLLRDVNGVKGGMDKHCRMIFGLNDGNQVIVDKFGTSWTVAVNSAAACAGRAVARTLSLRLAGRRGTNLRAS